MYAARILHHFGTPEGAYFAGREELQACPGLPEKVRQALEDKDLSQADQILAQCEALGIWVLTCQDAAYPQRLGQLDSAPCVLYGRGRLPQMDQEAAVALVGARQASPYGIMAAGRLGLDLARQGALVVSGMAQGVDAAALRGALRGGGRVVSVLGSGIDVIYPAGHGDLYEDVAAAGALLSEYPPGTPPTGPHFPVRNRLIAGLSLGVLVVEGSQTSGALITARWALEQGRDVFAVPGGIDLVKPDCHAGTGQAVRRGPGASGMARARGPVPWKYQQYSIPAGILPVCCGIPRPRGGWRSDGEYYKQNQSPHHPHPQADRGPKVPAAGGGHGV